MATASLDRVLAKELEAIRARRQRFGIETLNSDRHTSDSGERFKQHHFKGSDQQSEQAIDVRDIDTIGVCFSSGGLRSAAFASGFLRSFATSGMLSKVDYISCVSGGACTVASFISHVSCESELMNHQKEFRAKRDGGQDAAQELANGAERSLHQLRRNCSSPFARGHVGEIFLFSLQVSCALFNALVVCPLMVVAACIIFSSTVDAIIGNALRDMLQNGLVDMHWLHNGWLVFLGPMMLAAFCLSFAQLQRRHAPCDSDGLKQGSTYNASPAGQIALVLSSILFAVWGVIILMFLDERLFRGTIADEAVQAIVALMWALTVVSLVVGSPLVNQRRIALVSCLWSLVGWSVLWLTARIHVLRITGRLDSYRVNEMSVAAFLLLALMHDYLLRGVHPLYRQRLKTAFFCNMDSAEASCANLCKELLEAPQGATFGVGERWSGNAARHGKASPLTSSWLSQMTEEGYKRQGDVSISITSPGCNLGDLYYGKQPNVTVPLFQQRTSLPKQQCRLSGQEDDLVPGDKFDPVLAELDLSTLPYLLVNTVARGYVRKRFSYRSPNQEADVCQFLLSPLFCGSERTGYLQTPHTLTLSTALAMCCNNDPFSAASSDMGDSLQHRFPRLGLQTGDWLSLTSNFRGGKMPPAAASEANPTPNFFLDPTGSRPMPRPSREPVFQLESIPPWLAQSLAPALALSSIFSLIDPIFLLIPIGAGLAALLLSFLPNGRPLLHSPQIRGMHRILGAVHSSDRPPPFIHLSDGTAGDALGLLELLKRRCAKIFVCDSVLDRHVECNELINVLEQARRELGCAFLPTPGCTGDVSTALRDFRLDANARILHIKVHYFARPRSVSAPAAVWCRELWGNMPQEELVKIGDVFVLKCRATPRDKDLQEMGLSVSTPEACEACPLVCDCAPPKGVRGLLRMWRTSCVDAAEQAVLQEPSHRFCSQKAFTRFSALGARAAWAALELCSESLRDDASAARGSTLSANDLHCKSGTSSTPSQTQFDTLKVSQSTAMSALHISTSDACIGQSKAEYVQVSPSDSVLSFH